MKTLSSRAHGGEGAFAPLSSLGMTGGASWRLKVAVLHQADRKDIGGRLRDGGD